MKIELYKYTPANIRYWCAEADYEGGAIVIKHGVLHGVMQYQSEFVEENQSGRTIEEQVDLYLESRANKKIDIGYRKTIEESKAAAGNNVLGFHRPMLAKRIDQMRDIDYDDCYVQMKYDGHRCLMTRTSNGIVAYSRVGRLIDSIDHIKSGIQMPMGMTLDGELYCHGVPLQTISSWVKAKQPNTLKLEYVIYDVVMPLPYDARYNVINNLELGKHARIAPTDKSVSESHVPLLLDTALSMGYEGIMLRQCKFKYEPGKRSKGLIKVKGLMDDEFVVTNITASADGWAVLTCEAKNGQTFGVSAPGTVGEKVDVLRNAAEYIGKHVTVQYANLTDSGIPFHPVAVRWHETV